MASRSELRRRLDEVCDEIRHYPGPIARCDLHLPALIEERSRLLSFLNQEQDLTNPCPPEAVWINDGGFNGA